MKNLEEEKFGTWNNYKKCCHLTPYMNVSFFLLYIYRKLSCDISQHFLLIGHNLLFESVQNYLLGLKVACIIQRVAI